MQKTLPQRIIRTIRDWFNPPEKKFKDIPYRTNRLAERYRAEIERTEIVRQCRKMAATDPRIIGMIEKLSQDAVAGGFRVQVNNSQRAQVVSDDLLKRLKLALQLDDYLTTAQKDGDLFLELSIAGNQIVGLSEKPTMEMHRNSDDTDMFTDPSKAHWQTEDYYGLTPPDDAIWYADIEILHARWRHTASNRYGLPQFAPATSAWKKLTDGETNLAIRRMVRAGLRLYHFVEGDESDIEKYRENNQIALESPDAALIDLFGNTEKGPEVIKGDDQLDKIEDVKHHLETVQTASPVPLTLIGYGHELNRDILEQKLQSYEEALPFVNEWLELQIIIPILETEWLLKGLWPEAIDYEIVWAGEEKKQAAKEVQRIEAAKGKAEAASAIVEAGQRMISLGWQESVVAEIIAEMLNDLGLEIDPKQLLKPNQSDRLAMIVSQNGNGTVPTINGQPQRTIQQQI